MFRARDAERAKRFLLDDLVVRQRLTYYIVETPEGNWGRDIDGLFLGNLLPWQRDVDAARFAARIIGVPSVGNRSGGLHSAAAGVADNYTAELECGRCGAQWWDGIRYRDDTAVRCPACRSVNRVDGRGYTVGFYSAPAEQDSPAEPRPHVASGAWVSLTAAEIADPQGVGG